QEILRGLCDLCGCFLRTHFALLHSRHIHVTRRVLTIRTIAIRRVCVSAPRGNHPAVCGRWATSTRIASVPSSHAASPVGRWALARDRDRARTILSTRLEHW